MNVLYENMLSIIASYLFISFIWDVYSDDYIIVKKK